MSKLNWISERWFPFSIEILVTEEEERLHLWKLVIPKYLRGKGYGTRCMVELLTYANRCGKVVTLNVSDELGGAEDRLIDFYKRLGFVENEAEQKISYITTGMYRLPKGVSKFESKHADKPPIDNPNRNL